jgi:hypothetical protein
MLYVGEGDPIRPRLESHRKRGRAAQQGACGFWSRASSQGRAGAHLQRQGRSTGYSQGFVVRAGSQAVV